MIYSLKVEPDRWSSQYRGPRGAQPYADIEERTGSVEILFSIDGVSDTYKNDCINIPLFLTELDLFLNGVNPRTITQWDLGFSPFAFGKMKGEALLLSSRGDLGFENSVYDRTTREELHNLKTKLRADILKYGSVVLAN